VEIQTDVQGAGNFVRVKVRLDVRKPLKSVVSMSRGGKRELFLVRYEKLPNWCQVCGHLGHEYKEHGDGIHPPSAPLLKNFAWDGDHVKEVAGLTGAPVEGEEVLAQAGELYLFRRILLLLALKRN
jgi:hypothetical protein